MLESLPLVSTYLSTKEVELDMLGLPVPNDVDDYTNVFLAELLGRHAIARGRKLRGLLPSIERATSSAPVLELQESKGTLRGRLDIPHYLASRAQQRSLPRRYPVIVSRERPQTPENALVVRALKALSLALGSSPFHRNSAEGQASLALYDWSRSRLRRFPWSEVSVHGSTDLLRRQVELRLRKGRTGNRVPYSELLRWFDKWDFDPAKLPASDQAQLVEDMLVFPPSESFWDKVFEIWCLWRIDVGLRHLGCALQGAPRPLSQRHRAPVLAYLRGTESLSLWFQRQKPLGSPRWRYADSATPLRGVPDITITSTHRPPLVVDAKFRLVSPQEQSRSDEVYKMLGYAENFRDPEAQTGFHGVLVFIGGREQRRPLAGPNGSTLSLCVIDTSNTAGAFPATVIEESISEWLRSPTGAQHGGQLVLPA